MTGDARWVAGAEEGQTRPKPLERARGAAALVGISPAVERLRAEIRRLAPYPCSLVIYGDTGVGKEVVARALHEESGATGNFIAVNCANLAGELVEAKLFGHDKGAFTHALRELRGCIERAARGTLLLDEGNELPLATQAKLLRVLQDGVFERLGGDKPLNASCRVLVACQRDLEEEAQAGRFRLDLYYRVAVEELFIPPLRERLEDIPLLVVHLARNHGVFVDPPCREALELLVQWHWPGNVRELDCIVQRAIMLSGARAGARFRLSGELVARALRRAERLSAPRVAPWAARLAAIADARGLVEAQEMELLVAVYEEAGRDVRTAAGRIGWDFRKLSRHLGLDPAKAGSDSLQREATPARGELNHASSVG